MGGREGEREGGEGKCTGGPLPVDKAGEWWEVAYPHLYSDSANLHLCTPSSLSLSVSPSPSFLSAWKQVCCHDNTLYPRPPHVRQNGEKVLLF